MWSLLLLCLMFTCAVGQDGYANQDEFRFLVHIYRYESFRCTGAILTPNIIITEGSCMEGHPSIIGVKAGSIKIQENEEYEIAQDLEQFREVEGYVLHPDFEYDLSCTFANSIGLMYLKEPFLLNEHVQPIRLPERNETIDWDTTMKIGFGITYKKYEEDYFRPYSPDLKKLTVFFNDEIPCKMFLYGGFNRELDKEELCGVSNYSSVDLCVMDIGSPNVCEGSASSAPLLCGIDSATSNLEPCEMMGFSISNNIQMFLDFIEDAMNYITYRLKCDKNHIYCASEHSCLPRSKVCDGNKDCALGEDEWDCANLKPCKEDQFRCNDGRCIPLKHRCDGKSQCQRKPNDYLGTDEEKCYDRRSGNCPNGLFSCGKGDRCVSEEYKCDGVPDCLNSSDESDCDQAGFSNKKAEKKPTKNWMSYGSKEYFNQEVICKAQRGPLGKNTLVPCETSYPYEGFTSKMEQKMARMAKMRDEL